MMGATQGSETLYAVITAARNEERFITGLIDSLSSQTLPPALWIVVVDNSTDATERIATEAAAKRPWMRVMTNPAVSNLGFDSKARAVMAAYESLDVARCDLVAYIDADISFEPTYCESLVQAFESEPRLGVAGTGYTEGARQFLVRKMANYVDVPGGCQFFRRACFDEIGGYEWLPHGGMDTLANTRARMLGWKTTVFPGLFFDHRRPVGRGGRGNLSASLMLGRRAYLLGGHPAWETARALTHVTRKPPIVGAGLELFGYWSAMLRRTERSLPPDVVAFRRTEQRQRLLTGPSTSRPGVGPKRRDGDSKTQTVD